MTQHIVPRDKWDDKAIENLQNCSFDEVRDKVPALLEWLQDMNWPVAGGIFDFLLPHVNEIEDEIIKIFRTDDGMWKYWILGLIDNYQGKVNERIVNEIVRVYNEPTPDEIDCGVHEDVQEMIEKFRQKGIL
ncbi:DUF5071 domain-containing protein [Flavobacterium suzhouense]|uniref:DUF5071 domain-containing protein n=1 Tax=Flavobacterium suzhouense TaxID=1529638 RepID=A0ABW5NNN0_9FLAO